MTDFKSTTSVMVLCFVFTNKDWYIFEPQTGQFIELHKYPNQEFIQYIAE